MEDAAAALEQKVVEQASVTSEHLGPDPARAGSDVTVGERREIAAHVRHCGALDGGTPDLDAPGPPVPTGEMPRPGIPDAAPTRHATECSRGRTPRDGTTALRSGQPTPHRSCVGEVDAEEGERRIGHRVDEPVHESPSAGGELEVVAAERCDSISPLVDAGQSRPTGPIARRYRRPPSGRQSRHPIRAARRTPGRGSRYPTPGCRGAPRHRGCGRRRRRRSATRS